MTSPVRKPVEIVAELSGNHNGDLDLARRTITAMRAAGANAVKLQTYRPESLTLDLHEPPFGPLQSGPWKGTRPYALFRQGAMPYAWHAELFELARSLGLDCFSSPFDEEAVELLEELGCPRYKIASLEIAHVPLLERVAKTGKPVILSTGIATYADLELALQVLGPGRRDLTLLKCTSAYPAAPDQANLRSMATLSARFGCPVGLSDHTMGHEVAAAAVALGAVLIEKHFVLDRSAGGLDASFSMEPAEFRALVDAIRTTEAALGTERFEAEEGQRARGRSIFVARDLAIGEPFTRDNLKVVRPGQGLHPRHYRELLGMSARRALRAGTPLAWADVKRDESES